MVLRLDLVVGPNGAGKSTFVTKTLARALPPTAFVNADEIAEQRWPGREEAHAYDAARVAAETRAALIAARRPFIAETVFSHPSKLELVDDARTAGYTVFLHVLLVPESLSVARVAHRVAAGGHSVPEGKIRARYERLWPLVARAIRISDDSTVYDSAGRAGPRIVAHLVGGVLDGDPSWPAWTPPSLREAWPGTT